MEFAIEKLPFGIDERKRIGPIPMHLSVARRYASVGENLQRLMGAFWPQRNKVPEGVIVRSNIGSGISKID